MALVDELAYMLAGKEKKTHAVTPGETLWSKALVKTLAVTVAEVKAKKVSHRLDHVQSKALVKKLPATVAEMEAKTIGGTLHDVEAKAQVDTTADTTRGESENRHIELW